MYRLVAALLVVLVTLVVLVSSDADAFPGRNGAIVYGWSSFTESELEPFATLLDESAIQSISPRGGEPTTLRGCRKAAGEADVGDCTLPSYANPALSSNGRRVVFDAGASLAIMDADGARFRLLPAHGGDDGEPAFSPTGPQLVFSVGAAAAPPDATRELWLSDRAGAGAHRLLDDGTHPSWSTRNWIAFLRDDGVYRIRPNGRGLRRLATRTRCTDVAWSPHGTKVAFACRGRLIVANADGRYAHRVTGVTGAVDLAWSPDGTRFALHEFDSGVRTIRTDGSHGRMLVAGGVGAVYRFDANGVDWQPLR